MQGAGAVLGEGRKEDREKSTDVTMEKRNLQRYLW